MTRFSTGGFPVSKGWVDDRGVSSDAFKPRPDDKTGLSVYRAKFLSVEDAAKGPSKYGYYVLAMRAEDLRAEGVEIVSRPQDELPGHAESFAHEVGLLIRPCYVSFFSTTQMLR